MKYKLYYRESNLNIDYFIKENFGLTFKEKSSTWSIRSMETLLLDEQQALILKLSFPFVILFKEHERYVYIDLDDNT